MEKVNLVSLPFCPYIVFHLLSREGGQGIMFQEKQGFH